MELTTESIPLLVVGLSCTFMANLNVSVSVHHRIPRALSTGRLLLLKSKSLTSLVHSFSGNDNRTALLLLTHFIKWNPPLEHTEIRLWDSLIAASSDATDFKQSSM